MPEHLRALAVLLPLSAVVFAFARRAACTISIATGDYKRRRNLWFGVTLAAFLAHNFWIFIVLAGALIVVGARRESNKIALYYFLFFAMPMIAERIPGFGFIDHLFVIHYGRLLSLTILLPVFVTLRKFSPCAPKFGYHLQDKILVVYLALLFLLQLRSNTFTNTLRFSVFYAFVDIFLPYYVASRVLNTLQDFRDALMSFVVACMILASVAVLEIGRHWLLYSELSHALGVPWDYGGYIARGQFLRALATTGQPIALGFVLAVALGILLYLKVAAGGRTIWRLGLATILGVCWQRCLGDPGLALPQWWSCSRSVGLGQ